MQINRLLPLLINILAGPKEINKPANSTEFSKIMHKGTEKPQESIASDFKSISLEKPAEQSQNKSIQTTPEFLPLPIKSDLYEQADFFVKNNTDENRNSDAQQKEIFIRLNTENIGLLWISLAGAEDSLKIILYTERESYTIMFQEVMPFLVDELQQLGYNKVTVNAVTRQGIKSCAEISSSKNPSQLYLIDMEV
ncbi:MAG: flagellar hook-length control protein FliK [Peptococcaceae bacterium]|nr:flagellar hook-length control protein FliK [Peptococcaceae bacterium]